MSLIKSLGLFIASCSVGSLLWVNDVVSTKGLVFDRVYAQQSEESVYERNRREVSEYMSYIPNGTFEKEELNSYIEIAREQGFEPRAAHCFELEEILFEVIREKIKESNVNGENADNLFHSWFNSECFWREREFSSKEDLNESDMDRALFYLAICTHPEIFPLNPDIHYLRGRCLEKVDRLDDAIEEYQIATDLLPIYYNIPERLLSGK